MISNEIALIGNISLDVTIYTDLSNINFNIGLEDYPAKKIAACVGGCVVNIGKAIATIGGKPQIFSLFAKDLIGELLINQLKDINIGTKHLIPVLQENNKTVLFVKSDGNKEMFYQRTQIPNQKMIETLAISRLKEYSYIHVSLNNWTKPIVKKLQKDYSSISFSTDLHLNLDELQNDDIISSMRIVFFSGAGRDNQYEIINRILDMGPEIVICAMGDKGCLVGKKGEGIKSYNSIIQHDTIVDTIGAGDVLAATFLSEYYKHFNFKESLLKAQIQAGNSCIKIGLDHLFTGDELEQLYQKYKESYFAD